MLPTITGVAQRYERQTFNLVVRGSIPLIGITEGDTAQGAKTNMVQTIFFAPLFQWSRMRVLYFLKLACDTSSILVWSIWRVKQLKEHYVVSNRRQIRLIVCVKQSAVYGSEHTTNPSFAICDVIDNDY